MTEKKAQRILHVDDDQSTLESMKVNLHRQGYAVTSVNSGDEALDVLEQQSFDAILLDICMPGLNGIALLRQILRRNPKLPVIMLTGMDGNDELFDSVASGCSGFLEKPCVPQQLHDLIQECIGNADGGDDNP